MSQYNTGDIERAEEELGGAVMPPLGSRKEMHQRVWGFTICLKCGTELDFWNSTMCMPYVYEGEMSEISCEEPSDSQKVISELQTENERLRKEKGELKVALENLVNRLDVVHDDSKYVAVWQLYQIRCGPYSGPQYEKEFKAAKTVLNSLAEKGATQA